MDHDKPSPGRRKVRFAPRAPQPSRKPKLTVTKSEASDEDGEAAQAQYLLGRFNENQTRHRPKAETKSQIAFGPGAPSSNLLRTYGGQRGGTSSKSTDLRKSPNDNNGQVICSLPSTSKEDWTDICISDAIEEESAPKIQREYIEPWDYRHSNYPITLPLRRPYSGDPELLDKAEFAEAARKEYKESTINPASDLGLLDEGEKAKMFFFQFPNKLPIPKRSVTTKGKEKAENSILSERFGALDKGYQFEELPAGCMGKMLVYKSGAVKLKLGETLYDVSPGSDCLFAQNVAAINTKEKHCCVVGELGKRAVVTPDISSVLNSVIDLG